VAGAFVNTIEPGTSKMQLGFTQSLRLSELRPIVYTSNPATQLRTMAV
jgi:hypothetical protein